MIKKLLKKTLSEKQKRCVKSKYNTMRGFIINSLLSYGANDLKATLKELGIRETDTVLVHSNSNPDSGFKGTPSDVVESLAQLLGENGNLLMVSIPFRGTTFDHLSKGKPFHRDRTISMMGLITEIFRRRPGVLRSLHPTHPVLALGRDSVWLTTGHESCTTPCGAGTPFEKFLQLDGKILFYDVPFGAITFFHYVEDVTKDLLPFNVYHDKPFTITAFDERKQGHVVEVYAFNPAVTRNAYKVEEEMKRQGLVKYGKVGNSRLILVNAKDVLKCQTAMIKDGNLPYGRHKTSDKGAHKESTQNG